MDYEEVSAEVRRLAQELRDAGPARVDAEQTRLRELAATIQDDVSRRSALARVSALPRLIGGPHPGSSPQYVEATSLAGRAHGLAGRAHGSGGSFEERVAEAARIRDRIAELAAQAPAGESGTILRMTGSITRLIGDLEASGR